MALTCPQLCPQFPPDFNGLSRAMLDTKITVSINFKGFGGLSRMVLEEVLVRRPDSNRHVFLRLILNQLRLTSH